MKVNCVVLFPNQGTCHGGENSVILKLQHKLEREKIQPGKLFAKRCSETKTWRKFKSHLAVLQT